MAVLKKLRSRLFSLGGGGDAFPREVATTLPSPVRYAPQTFHPTGFDLRPLTGAQLEECWRLDQRCFFDGEAYSRETFDYLLNAPEAICYRAVTIEGVMVGFIVGLLEPQATGHITTIGVAPEHRRRGLARRLMERIEEGFRRRDITTVRLEVRTSNTGAQKLYAALGYTVTQRLPKYYSNGGDGLMMVKSLSKS